MAIKHITFGIIKHGKGRPNGKEGTLAVFGAEIARNYANDGESLAPRFLLPDDTGPKIGVQKSLARITLPPPNILLNDNHFLETRFYDFLDVVNLAAKGLGLVVFSIIFNDYLNATFKSSLSVS